MAKTMQPAAEVDLQRHEWSSKQLSKVQTSITTTSVKLVGLPKQLGKGVEPDGNGKYRGSILPDNRKRSGDAIIGELLPKKKGEWQRYDHTTSKWRQSNHWMKMLDGILTQLGVDGLFEAGQEVACYKAVPFTDTDGKVKTANCPRLLFGILQFQEAKRVQGSAQAVIESAYYLVKTGNDGNFISVSLASTMTKSVNVEL
jgi:hypothetical protein